MRPIYQIDCFKVNMIFWRIIGIWPGNKTSQLYACYSKCIVSTYIILYNALFSINFYFVEKSLDRVVEEMIFYFTEIACSAKVFTYLVMRKDIEKILTTLESDLFQPKTNTGKKVIERAKKLNIRYWKIVAIVSVTCNIAHVFIPIFAHLIFSAKLDLPVCSYSFLSENMKDSFKYSLYFYQSSGIHFVMWYNVNIDTFILGVIILIIAQLDILNNELKNLTSKIEFRRENKTFILKEQNLMQEFNKCVIHYNAVTKFCRLFQRVFSVSLFIQFSMASYIICVCLFRFTLPAPWQYYIFLLCYMFVMVLQVLVPCWFGTHIIEKSSRLSIAMYECNWLPRSQRFKTNMKLFVERVHRPLSITGWKMFPLSLKTFTSIINSAYSFFALLRHMQSRQ